jgi:hypothetical protein
MPGSPTSESQHSAIRQLKLLVLVLIISNIALGIFGFFLLRAVDRKYSDLINQTVPSINQLQTLTAASIEAMRATNAILFQTPANEPTAVAQHSKSIIEHESAMRNSALNDGSVVLNQNDRAAVQETGNAFSREALQVVQMFESGRHDEAVGARETRLRPAFDRYVACLTKSADSLQEEGLRTSGSLSERTGNLSHMMLGVASWPVILVGLFFVTAMVFVAGVLLKVVLFPAVER